jgi:hypothetical protein
MLENRRATWRAPLLIAFILTAMLYAKMAQHSEVEAAEADTIEVTGSTTR